MAGAAALDDAAWSVSARDVGYPVMGPHPSRSGVRAADDNAARPAAVPAGPVVAA